IGCQSYSFRDRPLDAAIKAIAEVGLAECELYMGHVEPNVERGKEGREKLRQWRTTVSLDEFKGIRNKFDDAGINLYAYYYNFHDDMDDAEQDSGFESEKALGAKSITASSTLATAKRLAPYDNKHKIPVGMHENSNVKDPNEFDKPDSFVQA